MTMRDKDVLLATRSDLRDALMAGDTDKAERIYQECEAEDQSHQPRCAQQAECAPRADAEKDAANVAKALEACDWSGVSIGNKAIIRRAIAILAANKEPQ